jgi:hypothetical protein
MAPVTYLLTSEALTNVPDAAGIWQIEVGKVFHNTRESLPIADYSYVRRFNNGTLNSQMLWATLFFVGEGSPENVTLHGSHDLGSGDEVGSISAASATHAARIGHQFTRVGVTLTIG